jgi:pyruvate/2-oxoglutarate dehydrogenase complex dihydrolipoamide dehydrogenase (E3) component
MAQLLRPDICVIGAGAGGLTVAAAASAFGVPVVLIEKGRMGGGSLNTGSVPSKALIAAAARANVLRNGARFGLKTVRYGVDFSAVNAYVRNAIATTAPQDSRERFNGLGVRVINGTARFADRRTVTVDDITVKARRFVIATGSSPAIPAIPGLAETPHFTNETIFDLTDCPRHLIVLGAGTVGLELAQAYRRLGADVTVLERAAPLASNDPECAAIVLDALTREDIALHMGVKIAQVRRSLARVQVVIARDGSTGEETIEGTHLLIATGRRPNFEELALDVAGIRHEPHGITVDKHLRTSNKRVYAVGDVTGGPKFAHVASYQAALVVRHALFRTRFKVDHQAIPSVVYTDPELAQVGFQEDEARAHAGSIRVLRWPFRENDRAQTTGATNGHIKIITDRRGDILGAAIVGASASENIAAWALAINQKLNIRAFAGLIVPYPTYAEVGKRAAMTYFTRGLTSPLVRRIIGWLRRLG